MMISKPYQFRQQAKQPNLLYYKYKTGEPWNLFHKSELVKISLQFLSITDVEYKPRQTNLYKPISCKLLLSVQSQRWKICYWNLFISFWYFLIDAQTLFAFKHLHIARKGIRLSHWQNLWGTFRYLTPFTLFSL